MINGVFVYIYRFAAVIKVKLDEYCNSVANDIQNCNISEFDRQSVLVEKEQTSKLTEMSDSVVHLHLQNTVKGNMSHKKSCDH